MYSRLYLVVLGAMLGACAPQAQPVPAGAVSVSEAVAHIHEWNGKVLTIVGWLGTCGGLDCQVFDTLEDARTVARGDYKSSEWSEAMDRSLAIDSDKDFDAKADDFQFKFVIIKGRLSDECRRDGVACFDRASEISPISVSPAILPKKAI